MGEMEPKERDSSTFATTMKLLEDTYSKRRLFRDPIEESMQRIRMFKEEWLQQKLMAPSKDTSLTVRHLNSTLSEIDLALFRGRSTQTETGHASD
jgi:hypothetical protein